MDQEYNELASLPLRKGQRFAKKALSNSPKKNATLSWKAPELAMQLLGHLVDQAPQPLGKGRWTPHPFKSALER